MASEEEIKKLREQFANRLETIERIRAKETAEQVPLVDRMKTNREIYDKVFNIQKDTFMSYSIKKWQIKKDEAEEVFLEFWTEFENKKTNSIREFLTERGYKEKQKEEK